MVATGLVAHGWVLTVAAEADPGAPAEAAMSGSLIARKQALVDRLRDVAADADLVRLTDGISGGSERRIAAHTLAALRGSDGSIVADVCITRLSDRKRSVLSGDSADAMCAGRTVRRLVAAAPAGTIFQTLPMATDGRHRLLMTAALSSVPNQAAAVIAAEVDMEALLGDVVPLNTGTLAAMLVDLDTSTVLASAGELSAIGQYGNDPSGGLEPYASEFLYGGAAPFGAPGDPGLGATISPLWTTTDGTRLGLIEVAAIGALPSAADSGGILLPLAGGALVLVVLLIGWSIRRASRPSAAAARIEVLHYEAQEASNSDPLTGLPNRRAYEQELTRRMEAYFDSGMAFAVAHLDVDDLREVNDCEGQQAGDEVLIGVAETLQQLLRPDDQVFRTGGDDFAVLLPGLDPDAATANLERVLHFCRRPASGIRPSSFSCGVSGVPRYSTDSDIVGQQASAVLGWIKAHGRGAVEVYDPERDRVPDQPHDIANLAVQEVVTGKLLSPVFQPIVDLRNGRVLGFEGLIRPDPLGPLPSTGHLFAAASVTGRTVELDLVCIELVLAGARAIGSDQLVTLNLSTRTLEMKDFHVGWLLDALMRNGIAPNRVVVELTEREAIADLPRLRRTFELLQSYGLRLAADDVGAGDPGSHLLSQVRFDIVKIDLSLVDESVHNLGSRAALESLRDVALGQHAQVVAEGVETAEQLQVIQDLDIGAAQGYLLGRPNRSVEAMFVDVRQLASGIVVPTSADLPGVVAPSNAAAAMRQPLVRPGVAWLDSAPGVA